MNAEKIILIVENYVGQEEILGNLGFKDEVFQKKMEEAGWAKGQAWCSYFAELIWKEAFKESDATVEEFERLFNGSAVKTWKNFLISPWKTSKNPADGAIVIWQNYKNGMAEWTGHAGICTGSTSTKFFTVEGNTNPEGGREGYAVSKKIRNYTYDMGNGLRLLGFIHPVKK